MHLACQPRGVAWQFFTICHHRLGRSAASVAAQTDACGCRATFEHPRRHPAESQCEYQLDPGIHIPQRFGGEATYSLGQHLLIQRKQL